jgi:hypothetical protein
MNCRGTRTFNVELVAIAREELGALDGDGGNGIGNGCQACEDAGQ